MLAPALPSSKLQNCLCWEGLASLWRAAVAVFGVGLGVFWFFALWRLGWVRPVSGYAGVRQLVVELICHGTGQDTPQADAATLSKLKAVS